MVGGVGRGGLFSLGPFLLASKGYKQRETPSPIREVETHARLLVRGRDQNYLFLYVSQLIEAGRSNVRVGAKLCIL